MTPAPGPSRRRARRRARRRVDAGVPVQPDGLAVFALWHVPDTPEGAICAHWQDDESQWWVREGSALRIVSAADARTRGWRWRRACESPAGA